MSAPSYPQIPFDAAFFLLFDGACTFYCPIQYSSRCSNTKPKTSRKMPLTSGAVCWNHSSLSASLCHDSDAVIRLKSLEFPPANENYYKHFEYNYS